MSVRRLKISRGGRISLPADIRHRWGESTLTLEDRGDHAVLRPAPDDPIAAARGSLKDLVGERTTEQMREKAREDEAEIEARRGSMA